MSKGEKDMLKYFYNNHKDFLIKNFFKKKLIIKISHRYIARFKLYE